MKKLILLSLTLLLTISFVISGITLAFFSDQESVGSSVFKMGNLSLTLVNTYSANDDPFEYEKSPSWTVQNTGTMNLNLRVKVMCEWEQNLKVETANDGVSEIKSEVISEALSVTTSAVVKVILIDDKLEIIEKNEVEIKEEPLYDVSLNNELWIQEGNGWYVYRYPIQPNETVQVDPKIWVNDSVWEGALDVYIEAEAEEFSSGGDYD